MARASRTGSAVDSVLLAVSLLASAAALFLPDPSRDRSAATLRRTVAAPFSLLQRRAELSRAAFMSYDDRMQRLGNATALENERRTLASENVRLRAMLGLGARLGYGFAAAQASPAQLESDLVATQMLEAFNLTVGARAGVQRFAPVVSAEGLVGMVETVDAASSIAVSYLHPDFRVSATTPNDSAFGIVQAHLGSARGLLEIRGVAFRSPLKAGQLIVSSGLGGTYPRGIAVGTVIREIVTPEKWARTYLLQPAAPLENVGPVFVLLKKRADEGVATVWMSPQAADSAARAVAAAGDSLARDMAMRESAARRAALDSLRDTTAIDSAVPRPVTAPSTTAPAAPARRTPAAAPGAVPPAAAPPAARPAGSTGTPAPATSPAARDTAAGPPRSATPRPTVPRPTVPRPTVPSPDGGAGRP